MPQRDRWAELPEAGAAEIRSWPAAALVTSTKLAKALGISLKTLSTWRERKIGPTPEPRQGPKNCASYYSVGSVLAWLDNNRRPAWEYERDWLVQKLGGWVLPVGDLRETLTEAETATVAVWLRKRSDVIKSLGMTWPNSQPMKVPNFEHAR